MKKFMMNAVLISSVLCALPFAHAKEKIVGGEHVTDVKEAPYIVSLSGVCGGSIISKKWILTAAHCAGYFTKAKAGVLNLKETGTSYTIKQVIRHPEYDSRTMTHDFALAEVEGEINFAGTNVRPVKIASADSVKEGYENPGIDSTVYGFGNLGEYQSNYPGHLNKVVVPLVSNEDANKDDAYKGEIDETMIAAGYTSGGKDSCQGDSGGPLVVFDHQNEPVQIGVVSWGEGCARANKYGIYSRVSTAHEWIQKTISE